MASPALLPARATVTGVARGPRRPRVFYEKVGLAILRKAWFNLDLAWAVALILTGALTLAL